MNTNWKTAGIVLLKLPFVFVPAVAWWVCAGTLALLLIVLFSQDSSAPNPYPSLKGVCRWITDAYVSSFKYLRECFV